MIKLLQQIKNYCARYHGRLNRRKQAQDLHVINPSTHPRITNEKIVLQEAKHVSLVLHGYMSNWK